MIGEHLRFEVLGHPEPAGSKEAVPPRGGARFAQVIDANPKAKGWKNVVAATARGAMLQSRRSLIEGPVRVEMVFRRSRPGAHVKKDGTLTLEGVRHEFPATKPDVLKLARAVEDACTGIVWRDDAQIVSEVLWKRYAAVGDVEGVTVTVVEL